MFNDQIEQFTEIWESFVAECRKKIQNNCVSIADVVVWINDRLNTQQREIEGLKAELVETKEDLKRETENHYECHILADAVRGITTGESTEKEIAELKEMKQAQSELSRIRGGVKVLTDSDNVSRKALESNGMSRADSDDRIASAYINGFERCGEYMKSDLDTLIGEKK